MTETDLLAGLADAAVAANQGDCWTFVGVLPDSGFIHSVHTGERNVAQAELFIQAIKDKSDGCAPLFHSDGWFYSEALSNVYAHFVPVPYAGRGRPAHPKRVVDPDLKYVQVCKERNEKGKIENITTKIVLGTEEAIKEVFSKAPRCKKINTDYVESRNGKYRKDNARLIRKTLCHSKKAVFHKAHILLVTQIFNYTRCVDNLKIISNPNAKKFEAKYQHRTPAMAENLTDKVWTIKDMLIKRTPIRC